MQLNGEVGIKTEFILPLHRPQKTYPARPIKYEIRDNGCWEVTSHKKLTKGYPGSYYQGKCVLVSRLSWLVFHKEMPDKCVLHKCDNRKCINPNHLFLGTRGDNARDMVAKGRSLMGERHHKAKLTEEDVKYIRRNPDGLRCSELAKKFGVKMDVINKVTKRKSGRYLNAEEV